MEYDNPAARLHAILVNGKGLDVNTPCIRAWASLLGVHKNDVPRIMSRLGKLMALPQEIIDATKELFPDRSPTWEHWSRQLNMAFGSQNLNGTWQTFVQHIDDHTINYLSMSADLLEYRTGTKKLSAEELAGLLARFQSLLLEIASSEIDSSVKRFMVHHIRAILSAIEEYAITGAFPILDGVEAVIGHAYLDDSFRKFLASDEIGGRVMEAMTAAANLVTVAVGIPQIAHYIQALTQQ